MACSNLLMELLLPVLRMNSLSKKVTFTFASKFIDPVLFAHKFHLLIGELDANISLQGSSIQNESFTSLQIR